MDRAGDSKFWIFFVLLAIIITPIIASVLPQTDEVRLGLLAWQQILFIVGGLMGTYKNLVLRLERKTFVCAVLSGFGLYLINLLLGFASIQIALKVLDCSLVEKLIMQEQLAVKVLLTSNKPLVFFGIVLLLTLGAPLGEELFFRGLLVSFWQQHLGAKKAIFFSALIFALLHFYLLQFVPVLISGILLGILFLKTENVFVPFVAHSVTNCLVLFVWLISL